MFNLKSLFRKQCGDTDGLLGERERESVPGGRLAIVFLKENIKGPCVHRVKG